jgi:GT2 family glycosyltransferase
MNENPEIVTYVPYHPSRPTACLMRALKSLNAATAKPHWVDVAVQGPLKGELPDPKHFRFRLNYHLLPENQGNAVPAAQSIERFLKTGAKWWCRLQDDIILPPQAWEKMLNALAYEVERGDFRVACCQMSTGGKVWMRPWCFDVRPRLGQMPLLRLEERSLASRGVGPLHWEVSSCVGFGSTIYARKPLEEGCLPDTKMFVGGIDTELAFQLHARGYTSLLMTAPTCNHTHAKCQGEGYHSIRYSRKSHLQSYERFKEKWNVDFRFLHEFAMREGHD